MMTEAAKDLRWYVLRVASGQEDRVRRGLEARVRAQGMEERIPRILVPTETVTAMKGGRRRTIKRKLYPGYVLVEMALDDPTWFLIRETPGVGDFIGGEHPWPLRPEEVARLLGQAEERQEEAPELKIDFKEGDMVEVKEGPFHDMKGQVEEINPASGRVKVLISVFNRPTSVELDYWQVEPA